MAWLRGKNRWVGSLMTLAVLGQVLAAATCCWPRHVDGAAEVPGLLGPMIICSAAGATAVAPDDTGTPGPHNKHCAMCTLVAGAALALLALCVVGLLEPSAGGRRLAWQRMLPVRDYLGFCGFRSRAPPLTA
jgi:hypothetical protein